MREIVWVITARLLNDFGGEDEDRIFVILDWKESNVRANRMYDVWVVTEDSM